MFDISSAAIDFACDDILASLKFPCSLSCLVLEYKTDLFCHYVNSSCLQLSYAQFDGEMHFSQHGFVSSAYLYLNSAYRVYDTRYLIMSDDYFPQRLLVYGQMKKEKEFCVSNVVCIIERDTRSFEENVIVLYYYDTKIYRTVSLRSAEKKLEFTKLFHYIEYLANHFHAKELWRKGLRRYTNSKNREKFLRGRKNVY